MSWIKNTWQRMFSEMPEERAEEAPEEIQPKSEAKKPPFRFPLISDEEIASFGSGRPDPKEEEPKKRNEKPYSKLQETQAKPAIRKIQPRRFQPTKVPSPVHGFNNYNPAPIDKLLKQKERKAEEVEPEPSPNPIAFVPAEWEKSLQAQKQIVKHDEPVLADEQPATAVAETTTEVEPVQKPSIDSEPIVQPVIEEDDKQEDEPKPLPMEKTVEPKRGTRKGFEPQKTIAELNASLKKESSQPKSKKDKTVPFNVLMLKSDKERAKKTPKPIPQIEAVATSEETASTPEQAAETVSPEVKPAYTHPGSSILRTPENDHRDQSWMEEQGGRLIEALSNFQVQATILGIVQGPAVTQFELKVAQGIKVSKIRNLADDLKLALAAKDIRIQAPIPGKSSIGIEIPNRTSRPVRISEIIDSPVFQDSDSPLEAALGLDLTGKPVTLDLRKMPHGLIAGATGSGKSVCINSILVSLLYKSTPRDLKMLLIDPKMVELAPYNHIPHLVSPVITDVKAATASLKWAVEEMERRYQLFAHSGVRDLDRYNKLVKEKGDHAQHLPYILIVIDELADLMMMSPSDVEDAICRIAQKARACGIHLVIATQRPSVDVITGLIKSNIPTRIAFSVSSQVDSRTILDMQGAERLLGKGDMLYLGNGMSAPVRIQGTFVTDEEIEDVISHVRKQGEPEYFFKEEELIKRSSASAEQDDLFEEACRFLMIQGSASTSLLQRQFHIGYNRAARLMDLIEQHGFISEQNGSKARTVLITEEDMEQVFQ